MVLYSDLFEVATSDYDKTSGSDVVDTMLAAFEAGETSLSDAATAKTQRLEALLVREAVSRREVEQARGHGSSPPG